jgi:hypothetical protein
MEVRSMLHAMRHAYYAACEQYLQSPSLPLARQLHGYAQDVRAGYDEAGDSENASLWEHNVAYWLDVLQRAGIFPSTRRVPISSLVATGAADLDAS